MFAEQVILSIGADDISPPLEFDPFTFSSWSAMARDCGFSRFWGGLHFEVGYQVLFLRNPSQKVPNYYGSRCCCNRSSLHVVMMTCEIKWSASYLFRSGACCWRFLGCSTCWSGAVWRQRYGRIHFCIVRQARERRRIRCNFQEGRRGAPDTAPSPQVNSPSFWDCPAQGLIEEQLAESSVEHVFHFFFCT